MELNINAWMDMLKEELLGEFGERLALLGLQGSRARGEARPDSDIDVVALITELDISDLQAYKEVLSRMPHADLACGFMASPKTLAAWPRYDSFNLFMDTNVIFGSFDFMDTHYTSRDAMDAAKSGASTIYHAVCHGILFDGDALSAIVADCAKSAFFVMRALAYARTGEYPATRAHMKEFASADELAFLEAYDHPASVDVDEMARRLFAWASDILEGIDNGSMASRQAIYRSNDRTVPEECF